MTSKNISRKNADEKIKLLIELWIDEVTGQISLKSATKLIDDRNN